MRILNLVCASLTAVIAVACNQTPISFEVSETSFSAAGGRQVLPLVMSVPESWTSVSPDWCRLAPSHGDALVDVAVYVEVDENSDSPLGRTGEITITAGGESRSIAVSQSHRLGATVPIDTYEAPCYYCSVSIEVYHTTPVTVEIPQDYQYWMSYVETKALDCSHIIIALEENRYYLQQRKGTLYIDDGFRKIPVTIVQAGRTTW